jgi:hypothetical protein
MPKFIALSLALILIGASSGCGSSQDSPESRRTNAEKQQALNDSAFGTMAGTMDRARGVEQLQQDHKNKLDATMD